MPGRITAVARHLKDPANKVYFATMEQGFYEVDVHSLAVKMLHKDCNVGGKNVVPGDHGKGCYTGQGRLVFANNGEAARALLGRVATAREDGGFAGRVGRRRGRSSTGNKYTDVTGPGGVYGSPDERCAALGHRLGRPLRAPERPRRRPVDPLPPAQGQSHPGPDHGWYTEWPRIREVGGGHLLMNMHDMFYDFPETFRPGNTAGIRPIIDVL